MESRKLHAGLIIIFLILVMSGFSVCPSNVTASCSLSVKVTLYIPVLQELSVSSKYPSMVIVQEEGKDRVRTSISLTQSEVDLSQNTIELSGAVDLEVFSNVDWRVMVTAENFDLDYTGSGMTPEMNLQVKAVNPSPGVTVLGSYIPVAAGGTIQIAHGGPLRKSFAVDYQINLEQIERQEITSASADLIYTLMTL